MAKAADAYSVCDLDYWPKNPLNNFVSKNCLLGAINIVKHCDKSKYIFSGYSI